MRTIKQLRNINNFFFKLIFSEENETDEIDSSNNESHV